MYYESYVRIQKYINLGNWEKYFSSKEAFHNKITSPVVELMNGTEKGDSTVVSDAYLKLMDWQYDYVQEHKAALDFITGKDYIESGGSKADLKQEQKDKEAKRKAEINKLQEAKKAAGISDDTSEKRGLVIIPLILVLGLPFSAVDYIGYKSTTQQKNIYHTLIEEDPVDGYIPRSRIIEIVQSEVCIFHLSSALFPGIQST